MVIAFLAGMLIGLVALSIFLLRLKKKNSIPSYVEYVEQYETEAGELKVRHWQESVQ